MPVNHFSKGSALYLEKKYLKAINLFNKAIKQNPESYKAWYFKGKALFDYNNDSTKRMIPKKYEEAKKYIDKALEIKPNKPDIWISKSKILNIIGPYEDALNCCYEAMKIRPNAFWLEAACTHECFKHYQEAIECIDKCILYRSKRSAHFSSRLNPPNMQNLRSGFVSGLKYGDNFYIPITIEELSNVIPLKSEIIYSTNMKITWITHYTSYKRQPQRHTAWIITEVLITLEGFACRFPTRRRPSSKLISPNFSPIFIPWSEARLPRRGHIKVGPKGETFIFRLVRSKLRESEKEFQHRAKNFQNDIRRLRGFE